MVPEQLKAIQFEFEKILKREVVIFELEVNKRGGWQYIEEITDIREL